MVGALVIAPGARLIPTGRAAMSVGVALFMAPISALIAGTIIWQELDAPDLVGLGAALCASCLHLVVVNRFGDDNGSGGWSPGFGGGGSDCGDSGGGDGGSCN